MAAMNASVSHLNAARAREEWEVQVDASTAHSRVPDAEYVVRRAMLLRGLIERKARQLLDSQDNVRIDANPGCPAWPRDWRVTSNALLELTRTGFNEP